MASTLDTVVCFEATGGQEWRLWVTLDTAGVPTRQLPPAQIKAFAASRGTRAKTDRIDAELIARFLAFRPDAGRTQPAQKIRLLRALTSKRGQLVETRKRFLAQIKAQGKLGTADLFDDFDNTLKTLLKGQIATLESRIEQIIALDRLQIPCPAMHRVGLSSTIARPGCHRHLLARHPGPYAILLADPGPAAEPPTRSPPFCTRSRPTKPR